MSAGNSYVGAGPNGVSVAMRQARLALDAIGKLDDVQTAIDALPEPQRRQAQITWDTSSFVERNNPFVTVLGAALGLTADDIDALFRAAATL